MLFANSEYLLKFGHCLASYWFPHFQFFSVFACDWNEQIGIVETDSLDILVDERDQCRCNEKAHIRHLEQLEQFFISHIEVMVEDTSPFI